jgi:ABC-type metal ion transport system substrate-binding protein
MTILRTAIAALLASALAACSSTSTSDSASAADVGTGAAPVAAQQQVAAAAASNDDGIKCKRVQITGTRMSEKVCTTRAQREEAARNAADAQRQVGIKAQQLGGPSSGA